jgi:hypothetical protein
MIINKTNLDDFLAPGAGLNLPVLGDLAKFEATWGPLDAILGSENITTLPLKCDGTPVSEADLLVQRLLSPLVQPEDVGQLQHRTEEIFEVLKPSNGWEKWHVSRVAVTTMRIEHTERAERRVREKIRLKAMLTWDSDRQLEAVMQGQGLATRPAPTVEILRGTPQGCDWLIKRWSQLAYAADCQSNIWTPEQTSMVFDLLATPAALRIGGKPGASIDHHGRVIHGADDSAAVARRAVDELLKHREVVAKLDLVKRAEAEADMAHHANAELRGIRRYESMLYTRLRWMTKQMEHEPRDRDKVDAYYTKWELEPPPREKPEPKTADQKAWEAHDKDSYSPPFCLKEHEAPPRGEKADIPKVLKSRKEEKLARAESRREAERRRAEKLYTK